MWSFPLGAAGVSGYFAYELLGGWAARHRPNLLAWGVALMLFAIASAAAGLGMLVGWNPSIFRLYYLCGAIINVPVLALGTIYLLANRRSAHLVALVVVAACLVATIVVFGVELKSLAPLSSSGIPAGSAVMTEGVRNISRAYSFAGFFVVVGGALYSAIRLARQREPRLRRLAAANSLIAAGTFVVAVASGFARYGRGAIFAVGLLVGVSIMYLGFRRSRA